MRLKEIFSKNGVKILLVSGVLIQICVLFFIMEPNEIFWKDPKQIYNVAYDLSLGIPYSTEENPKNLGRAPGYPYILSWVMRVIGPELVSVRLFHVFLFPFFLFSIYQLVKKWKNKTIALLALGGAAIYPYYLYVPLTLYPESLLIYIYLWTMVAIYYVRENKNNYGVFLIACLISLAVMIRPTSIVLFPVAFYCLFWKNDFSLRHGIVTAVVIVIIPVIFVSGWMIRNNNVHGSLMFTSKPTELLLNTYTENSRWDIKHPPLPERINRELKAAKTFKEKQQLAVREAKNFIAENPGRAFMIAFMQSIDLWNPYPRTITEGGLKLK